MIRLGNSHNHHCMRHPLAVLIFLSWNLVPCVVLAADVPPQSSQDYCHRGIQKSANADWASALQDFDKAIELDPKNVEAMSYRAVAKKAKGDDAGAAADETAERSILRELISQQADRIQALEHQAKLTAPANDQIVELEKKIETNRAQIREREQLVFTLTTEVAKQSTENERLGRIINRRNQEIYKLIDLLTGPEKVPKRDVATFLIGRATRESGNSEMALDLCNKAIEIDSKFALAFDTRGSIQVARQDLKGALTDFDQAIVLEPTNSSMYCHRAGARRVNGDLPGALVDCEQAIKIGAKNAAAYLERGMVKYDQGDKKAAALDFKQAQELNPNLAKQVQILLQKVDPAEPTK